MIPKITIPKSPYSGFNTKLTGRVSRKMLFKGANAGPIEFQQSKSAEAEKTASTNTECSGPVEWQRGYSTGQEKTAAGFSVSPALKNGFLQGVGALAAAGLAAGAAKGMDYLANQMNASKYDESLRTAIQMSPTLQRHGYEVLKGYMPMIIKASPTVAAEPRLLANYLESMLDAEGHLNMATMGELLGLEGQVLRNREANKSNFSSLGTQLTGAVIRSGAEAVGREAFKGVK